MSIAMKPASKAELEELIESAINRATEDMDSWAGIDNQQVVELYTLATGRKEAFQAVLDVMKENRRYALRVFAAGHICVAGD